MLPFKILSLFVISNVEDQNIVAINGLFVFMYMKMPKQGTQNLDETFFSLTIIQDHRYIPAPVTVPGAI